MSRTADSTLSWTVLSASVFRSRPKISIFPARLIAGFTPIFSMVICRRNGGLFGSVLKPGAATVMYGLFAWFALFQADTASQTETTAHRLETHMVIGATIEIHSCFTGPSYLKCRTFILPPQAQAIAHCTDFAPTRHDSCLLLGWGNRGRRLTGRRGPITVLSPPSLNWDRSCSMSGLEQPGQFLQAQSPGVDGHPQRCVNIHRHQRPHVVKRGDTAGGGDL